LELGHVWFEQLRGGFIVSRLAFERPEIENFLYLEARLADTHAYDAWLGLWSPDAHYWIPCNGDSHDLRHHISLVNEDYEGLIDRVTRLNSGAAWAQDPKSRLARIVSNVELEALDHYAGGQPVDDQPVGDQPVGLYPECLVHSTFNITAMRRARIEIIAGRATHRLRRTDDGIRIVSKKVILIDNDEVMSNITFLI
jgi:benzoate/toluate 1,2-dioxygenase subunit beta